MIKLIFLFILILEIIVFLLFKILKKDFQWLIEDKDTNPIFKKNLIQKYNKKILNKKLGWDNSKSNKKIEIINKKTKIHFEYNFSKNGSRLTGNKYKKINTIFFGDSYSFCRCSQDYQTIQHYFEKKIKSKVLNYGVGNYGLDQVMLKLKNTNLLKAKTIIIVFVPETISRIHSYWKHFLEFGNILAFKPKFEIRKDKLILYNKHIKKMTSSNINKTINSLKKKDIFFEEKFKKNIFTFPYFFSFCKKLNKNSKIFLNLLLFKLTNKNFYFEKAFSAVVRDNLIETQKYYNNKEYFNLLEKIIIDMNEYIVKKNKQAFFFVVPQLIDLKLFKKINYSEKFYMNIKKKYSLNIFDLTKEMSKLKNIENYYFDDFYGGHLNYKGNKIVSNLIFKKTR